MRILLADAAASRLVPISASQATYRAAPCDDCLRVLNADNSLYGGWVVLTSAAGVSRVPYMGFKGDYSKLDVLDFIAVFGNTDVGGAAR